MNSSANCPQAAQFSFLSRAHPPADVDVGVRPRFEARACSQRDLLAVPLQRRDQPISRGAGRNAASIVDADRFSLISTYHAPADDEEFDLQFAARHVIYPKL